MSLADGLACALQKYIDSKASFCHRGTMEGVPEKAEKTTQTGGGSADGAPRNVANYKIKCPSCSAKLAFEEGCVKCYGCGFSQC